MLWERWRLREQCTSVNSLMLESAANVAVEVRPFGFGLDQTFDYSRRHIVVTVHGMVAKLEP